MVVARETVRCEMEFKGQVRDDAADEIRRLRRSGVEVAGEMLPKWQRADLIVRPNDAAVAASAARRAVEIVIDAKRHAGVRFDALAAAFAEAAGLLAIGSPAALLAAARAIGSPARSLAIELSKLDDPAAHQVSELAYAAEYAWGAAEAAALVERGSRDTDAGDALERAATAARHAERALNYACYLATEREAQMRDVMSTLTAARRAAIIGAIECLRDAQVRSDRSMRLRKQYGRSHFGSGGASFKVVGTRGLVPEHFSNRFISGVAGLTVTDADKPARVVARGGDLLDGGRRWAECWEYSPNEGWRIVLGEGVDEIAYDVDIRAVWLAECGPVEQYR